MKLALALLLCASAVALRKSGGPPPSRAEPRSEAAPLVRPEAARARLVGLVRTRAAAKHGEERVRTRAAVREPTQPPQRGRGWWAVVLVAHVPFFLVCLFLVAGLVERIGYLFSGRAAARGGTLPPERPTVCVQLPMYNEPECCQRVIEAAAALRWPRDKLELQICDDSTDASAPLVDAEAARARAAGLNCYVLRRKNRQGYKSGAIEAGRAVTQAQFIAIVDADFLPTPDFLERALRYFYSDEGALHADLAFVQTQWGHLNDTDSLLTWVQALWVDDHHTLQMSYRASTFDFVNFTGTVGVWSAQAIADAGGWSSVSLVEDCELSFRALFAGYRSTFVKEIVQPGELPDTYTAYKAQQKRWTQGWAQVISLHLGTLLFRYECPPIKRVQLVYHMFVASQWVLWFVWLCLCPPLIWYGFILPSGDFSVLGLCIYTLPPLTWAALMTVMASFETRHTYDAPGAFSVCGALQRCFRIVPYLFINMGMLPHQAFSFLAGLLTLNSEFERTPKSGRTTPRSSRSGTPRSSPPSTPRSAHGGNAPQHVVKIHWAIYVEVAFVAYQLMWCLAFFLRYQAARFEPHAAGLLVPVAFAAYAGVSVLLVGAMYGDHRTDHYSRSCSDCAA